MKKVKLMLIAAIAILTIASCERVQPNYYGVLMTDFGKNGKSDYKIQKGRVFTAFSPGTELFQVPAWEQRGKFTDDSGNDRVLKLKSADNTEFNAKPLYSYEVIEEQVVDVVFRNARFGSGSSFMTSLEDNLLEPRIYDIIKEESRKYTTDTLMAEGGSLSFERKVQELIIEEFAKIGLRLKTFSSNLDFSEKVKSKIDTRNEVNTNISVLDQLILEQKKKNILAELTAQENIILSRGITPQLLQKQAIEKWDGKLPSTFSGNQLPFSLTIK